MIDPKTGQREHVMGELEHPAVSSMSEFEFYFIRLGFGAASSNKLTDSIGFATSRPVYLGR